MPKILKHINEIFTQDSDPIKDLGIGVFIKEFNKINKIANHDPYSNPDLSVYFFGENGFYLYSAEAIFYTLKYIAKNNLDAQSAYKLAYKELIKKYKGSVDEVLVKEKVSEYFKKKFDIDLKSESLNEKFTEESDPVHDLGIGIAAQFNEWIKQFTGATSGYEILNRQLVLCSMKGKLEFVKYLIERGADIHESVDEPLRYASFKGHDKIVKFLLDKGANVHANRNESLYLAAKYGHYLATKYLLEAGATFSGHAVDIISITSDPEIKELLKKYKRKNMRAKTIKEDAMGGVSAPMNTLNNVPGIGNVTPGTTTSFGSGDRWDNTINKKPYTQAKPIKGNKKKTRKTKRRVDEENTNPYDKVANMMIKRMGKETRSPFKKKKSKKNQNAMVQRKYEHTIATYDEYLNEIYTADLQNIPEESDLVDKFKDLFREKYPYISMELINKNIVDFLSQSHINKLSLDRAVDLFADYVLSQGLADDVEE